MVNAGADCRESNRAHSILHRQRQRVPVAVRQEFLFSSFAAMPDRPDGVDDESGGQPVPAGDASFPGRATAQLHTLDQQPGTGGAVDSAIDAATAEQRGVGGIDDGVDRQRDDVRFYRLQNVAC